MITNTQRPKFLNLLKIHLPVTGVASFAHRVSGAILFISLPFWVYVFSLSLHNAAAFQQALDLLTTPWLKLLLLIPAWSVVHHLFAGIRFLLLDIHIWNSLARARASAWVVNVASLLIFFIFALWVML